MQDKDIRHLERLAKICCDQEQRGALSEDLSSIIAMLNCLDQANLEGLDPLYGVCDGALRLREDQVSTDIHRDSLQKMAVETQDGYYLSPPMLAR